MWRSVVAGLCVTSVAWADGARPPRDVHHVDWANRGYTSVYAGADPVIVVDGEGTLDGLRFTVGTPVFADLDGDGHDDAIIVVWRETAQGHSASAIEIFTVRRGAVVRLAEITGGQGLRGGIDHVELDHRSLVVVRYAGPERQRERWRWKAGKLTEDVRARRRLD